MKLTNEKCIEVMKNLKTNSIDSIMKETVLFTAANIDKDFVSFELDNEYFEECKRILKTKN